MAHQAQAEAAVLLGYLREPQTQFPGPRPLLLELRQDGRETSFQKVLFERIHFPVHEPPHLIQKRLNVIRYCEIHYPILPGFVVALTDGSAGASIAHPRRMKWDQILPDTLGAGWTFSLSGAGSIEATPMNDPETSAITRTG
jgi:hypothetical protein